MKLLFCIIMFIVPGLVKFVAYSQVFMVAELNTENMFDFMHDSLKNDYEFTPDGQRRWTKSKYWKKINSIGKDILAIGNDSDGWHLPDMVALCEVENDTVMRDLTKRSLLRGARYDYVITNSPDLRGIDVALLYSPMSFRMIRNTAFRVTPVSGMRPTRDILYACGEVESGDTLHIFVVHAPSRSGGETATRKFRMRTAETLCMAIDSLRAESPDAKIITMGDFNDYCGDASMEYIYSKTLMTDVSMDSKGNNGAKGTYRYKGEWGSLDHMLVSGPLLPKVKECVVADSPFLMEEDKTYGGKKPRRFFNGYKYNKGYSDHLPLRMTLVL